MQAAPAALAQIPAPEADGPGLAPSGGMTRERARAVALRAVGFFALMYPACAAVLLLYPSHIRERLLVGDRGPLVTAVRDAALLAAAYTLAYRAQPGYAPREGPDKWRWGDSWCSECGSLCPARAAHCRACPFTGGCVGACNHPRYVLFLAAGVWCMKRVVADMLTCLEVCALRSSRSLDWNLAHNAPPLLLAAVCGFLGLCAFCLLMWHLFLVATNQTAREVLHPEKCPWLNCGRRRSGPVRGPFDRGLWRNLLEWLRAGEDSRWIAPPPPPPAVWQQAAAAL
eukprot:TRINITY_DN18704_c0_g1_i1.p1 TRINITY_DN18704_c0_g1~~TRINITY_DN18704_c0_g1_i1.p1  ORF type:complete len:284 (+),score=66.55 TRINITY_DN18704_c0_g1_i1:77-928(+)